MAQPATFDAVLTAAQSGDDHAFAALFTQLAPAVTAYLASGRVADPAGSTNEVFLRVFRNLARFTGDERHFRSWVFTIAHNVAVDERRRSRASERLDSADLIDATTSHIEDDVVSAERVSALLASLSGDQRDVLQLRLVDDRSIEDTARAVGKTIEAVKALQHRGVASLRRAIQRDGSVLPTRK